MIIMNIIIIIDYIDAIDNFFYAGDRERLSEHRKWALIIDNSKHLSL